MSSKIKVDQIENTSGSGDVAFTGTGGIKLDTIKSSGGTEGMTITSSGHLTFPKMVLENWRVSRNTTDVEISGTQEIIGSAGTLTGGMWVRDTRTGIAQRNVGITQSSGVFSFPSSGIYRVTLHGKFYGTTDYIGGYVFFSSNSGASFEAMDSAITESINGTHNNTSTTSIAVLDINSTTSRVRFQVYSSSTSGVKYRAKNDTAIEQAIACKAYFEQIG